MKNEVANHTLTANIFAIAFQFDSHGLKAVVYDSIRLRHHTDQALTRAHHERKLGYVKPDAIQDIVEEALADELKKRCCQITTATTDGEIPWGILVAASDLSLEFSSNLDRPSKNNRNPLRFRCCTWNLNPPNGYLD